jgi:hypothetical protein
MAKKNATINAAIVPSEINLRATVVRSRLADAIATKKLGGSAAELAEARKRLDESFYEFRRLITL